MSKKQTPHALMEALILNGCIFGNVQFGNCHKKDIFGILPGQFKCYHFFFRKKEFCLGFLSGNDWLYDINLCVLDDELSDGSKHFNHISEMIDSLAFSYLGHLMNLLRKIYYQKHFPPSVYSDSKEFLELSQMVKSNLPESLIAEKIKNIWKNLEKLNTCKKF